MTINPEYRLRNIRRQLRDMIMSRRLSADPEQTGVVELADFGKRCDKVAGFAAESVADLGIGCARTVSEEVELALRLASFMETLPRSKARIGRQCTLLEEAEARVAAALDSELTLIEEPVVVSLSALATKERELFSDLVEFRGRIEPSSAGEIEAPHVRRTLRRALLEHEQGPFQLSVSGDGVLRFGEFEFQATFMAEKLARAGNEPPEVRKALDLRESAPDVGLQDFLLVKAVDEALCFLLTPMLATPAFQSKARALPHRPGKRFTVRPEAVQCTIPGWEAKEAARGVEKVANRRAGPDWARLPRGAYLLKLLADGDDDLVADLLALGPALRRMEKGEPVEGTAPRADAALRRLLGML